jgi:hypothetical protein
MFKTGSSSIQAFLDRARLKNATYFGWDHPNHSTLFVLLFARRPEADWVFRQRGVSAETCADWRARAKEALTRQIEGSSEDLFIFSAERIYRGRPPELRACREFFSGFFPQIDVHCYVRDPMSYAASMLQQSLKTGDVPRPRALLPNFRLRIANLDDAFGRDAVKTRMYSRPADMRRNLVADFCNWTGVETDTATDVRVNSSMSAEATALLYLFRRHAGFALSSSRALAANGRMVRALTTIPGRRTTLAPEFFGADAAEIADDRLWMEERMQERFPSKQPDGPATVTFTSFDDLDAFGREVFQQRAGKPFAAEDWPGDTRSPGRFATSVTGALPRLASMLPLRSPLSRRRPG